MMEIWITILKTNWGKFTKFWKQVAKVLPKVANNLNLKSWKKKLISKSQLPPKVKKKFKLKNLVNKLKKMFLYYFY